MVRVDTEFHLEYLTRNLVSNHVLFFYHKNIKRPLLRRKVDFLLKGNYRFQNLAAIVQKKSRQTTLD